MGKFLKGAAILSIAGLLVKVMGVFFRVPLTNWVGADGLSYYSSAYVIYNLMLTVATAGLPTAVSRMVAERIAVNDYKSAKRVFRTALSVLSVFGLIGFSFMFFFSDFIADVLLANPGCALSVKAIAPAVFFVPVMAAYRGYFQGTQNMTPTALSQLIEQLFRVIVGLVLAYKFLPKGNEAVSAAATFGCSVGGFAGLLLIMFIFKLNKKRINTQIENSSVVYEKESFKVLIKEILVITIPVTLSSCVLPLVNTIDAMIVMRRLQSTGWTYAEAKLLWGRLGGYCDSIIALPSVFLNAMVMGILPMVATSFRLKDMDNTRKNSQSAIKISTMVSAPCAVGIFVLAFPILKILYSDPDIADEVVAAVPTLRLLCPTIIISAITSCLGAVLNGIGKQVKSLQFVIIGAVVKVISTFVFVGIHSINVNGAPLASIACDLTIMGLDMYALKKYLDLKFDTLRTFGKPIVSSCIMGLTVYGVYELLLNITSSFYILTAVSIIVGVVVYFALVLATKMMSKEELLTIRGGEKIVSKFGRFLN